MGTLAAPTSQAASAAAPPQPTAASLVPNASIVAREDLTPAIARFVIRPDEGSIPFRPGQYLTLGLEVGGRLVQRPYSTASSVGSRDLEFLVRLVAGGELTPHLWQLAVGDRLRVGRPKGVFTLIDGDPRTHLFVATGTGIAPFISMLDALRSRWGAPRAIVLHGVAHVGELAYRKRLSNDAASGLVYLPVVSRADGPGTDAWTGATGHVDGVIGALFRDQVVDADETVAYLCGNPGMLVTVGRVLADARVPPEAIRSEQYWVG
jgi:ferredoxin/flavodoxin---NADP+ reductase